MRRRRRRRRAENRRAEEVWSEDKYEDEGEAGVFWRPRQDRGTV